MRRRRWLRVAAALLIFFGIMAILVWFVYRPWALTWGASEEEVARPMPGDAIVREPLWSATRAVSIEATPEQIWPWIVQMGYLRAGFYSYDRLDNDGIPSADRILPEYQDLAVGDLIPLAPGASVKVTEMRRPESMVWVFVTEGAWEDATWVWGLYRNGESETRLVTRLRVSLDRVPTTLFLDLGEIIMMRKCMLGIKQRAENRDSDRLDVNREYSPDDRFAVLRYAGD